MYARLCGYRHSWKQRVLTTREVLTVMMFMHLFQASDWQDCPLHLELKETASSASVVSNVHIYTYNTRK